MSVGLPDDPYLAARSNIRETVKWLIAALAGMTAAIVGTAPLTGLGAPMPAWRLELALAGGTAGLLLVGAAVAIGILVTPPFFFGDVESDLELLATVNEHRDELLPPKVADYTELKIARDAAIATLRDATATPAERAAARTTLDQVAPWVDHVVSFAYYEKLRRRFEVWSRWLAGLAFAAAIAFSLFAWAANPGKSKAKWGEEAQAVPAPAAYFLTAASS